MGNKVRLSLIVMMALAITGGATACVSPKTGLPQEKYTVTRGNIAQVVNADGALSLPQQRKLAFGIDGKIDQVMVDEGDRVTKGQVLAKLETATLERVVKNAELAIKLAEADRQQAEAGLLTAQADLKQAGYGVKTAAADLDLAQSGVQTAQANLKQADNGVKSAQADLDSASNTLNKLSYPYTITTLNLNVPAAVQAVHDAQMYLDLAKTDLNGAAGSPEYTLAWDRFSKAMDALKLAQGNLLAGTGIDAFAAASTQTQGSSQPFQTPVFAASDYWSIMAAQLQMGKAHLGVDTANNTLTIAHLAVSTAQSVAAKAALATDSAQAALDKARAGVTYAQGVLSKAQLSVDKAGYDLETARDTLNKATITAPFDGLIAEVDVKAGDVFTQLDYNRTVFQLIDPRHMEFTIKVDEMDVLGVQPGQEASISIDAVPNFSPKGKVIFVSPLSKTEGGVVQYQVKIGFDVPEGSGLREGMSSTADIMISRHDNTLLLPNRAVSKNKSGKPAVKLLVDGQVQEKVIETGISNSLDTEIMSGLAEGDTVVIQTAAK